jgi:hypothetical protein
MPHLIAVSTREGLLSNATCSSFDLQMRLHTQIVALGDLVNIAKSCPVVNIEILQSLAPLIVSMVTSAPAKPQRWAWLKQTFLNMTHGLEVHVESQKLLGNSCGT